ncbi:DNA/RNA non-specific endonuclease [Carnobacteriaceae bacterium 52-44]
MKKFLKWFLIIVGIIIGIVPISVLSPVLFLLSVAGFWYFTKTKPHEKFSKYARNSALISAVGFIILVLSINSDTEPEVDTLASTDELVVDAEADEELEAEKESRKAEEERRRAEYKQSLERKEKRLQEKREKREKARLKQEEEKALSEANPNKSGESEAPKEVIKVPEGQEDVQVNEGIPFFSNEDIKSTEVYHRNGPLDSLGRVTAANALVGVEIMPAEERGSIGHHEPTGWKQASYANIGSGGWLYNRSHLIGHQLTGNDDFENLMTGTRWFNMRMLEYENFVAHYIESTENHVRYRVTPVFEGNNLVATGAYMEGFSIEDNGEGLMFNVYVPNIQSGVTINYADGSSVGPAGPSQEGEIAKYNSGGDSNSNSSGNSSNGSQATNPAPAPKPEPKPEPAPSNPSAGDLASVDANGNGKVTIQEAKDAGYSMPIYSDHWLYKYMDDRDGDGMVGE